jgi:hypothetical protein
MRNTITMTLALALASGSASALEAATTGTQATQATVGAINSKVDTSIAALQAQLTSFTYCSSIRKFYAPSDSKKDAKGCVGIGDYDLNMASASNVNLANGRLYSTNSASSNWGGLFYGPADYGGVYGQAGIYGVYGYATGNGYGVLGNATANSGGVGGYFTGGNSGVRAYGNVYGVIGEASGTGAVGVRGNAANTNGWAGYFTGYYGVYAQSDSTWAGEFYGYGSGTGGVYIGNSYGNAQLCLNGQCTTSLSGRFGGAFVTQSGYCYSANPQTGSCSCPSGFSNYYIAAGFSHLDGYICQK